MIDHPQNLKGARGGYTLLFAVLTAALVLGVAVFILGVSSKQYQLSASARDSIYSFYAADSGIECVALNSSGGPSGDGNLTNVYSTSSPTTITCGNSSHVPVQYTDMSPSDGSPITYTYDGVAYPAYETYDPTQPGNTWFSLQFSSPSGTSEATCARVTIIEYFDAQGNYHDVVQSRGYNHCTGTNGNSTLGPDTNNPDTVERALQLSHNTSS